VTFPIGHRAVDRTLKVRFAIVEIEAMLKGLGKSPTKFMPMSDTSAARARRELQTMMDRERSPTTK
jgi:hypothetical protein